MKKWIGKLTLLLGAALCFALAGTHSVFAADETTTQASAQLTEETAFVVDEEAPESSSCGADEFVPPGEDESVPPGEDESVPPGEDESALPDSGQAEGLAEVSPVSEESDTERVDCTVQEPTAEAEGELPVETETALASANDPPSEIEGEAAPVAQDATKTASAEEEDADSSVTIKRNLESALSMQVNGRIVSPQAPRMTSETIRFTADVLNAPSGVTYTFTLKRANGNTVATREGPVFEWRFANPAEYTVEVTVTAPDGQSASDTISFLIEAARPVIDDVLFSTGTTVKAYEPVTVSAKVRNAAGLTYRYSGVRPDGSTFTFGSKPSFSWTFFTVGEFQVELKLLNGSTVVDSRSERFTVLANPMTVQAGLITPTDPMTYQKVSGSATVAGGPARKYYRVDLIRSDGVTRIKMSSAPSFTWTFYTPGNYKVEYIVRDGMGGTVTDQVDLVVRPNVLSVDDIRGTLNGGNDLKVYDFVNFSGDVTGGIGDLNYTYELRRENNALISTIRKDAFRWRFMNSGNYKVNLKVTDSRGRTSNHSKMFSIAENPIVVSAFAPKRNGELKVYDPQTFVVSDTGGYGRKTYRYTLIRSDNSTVNLGSSTDPEVSWRFYTPADYTLRVNISDSLGNTASQLLPITLIENIPVITPLVNPGPTDPLYTGTMNRFAVSIDGGGTGGQRSYSFHLVRKNGSEVLMGKDRNNIKWTITSDTVAKFLVRFSDPIGLQYQAELPLNVLRPINPPVIISAKPNKTDMTEDINNVVLVTVEATGTQPLRYEYYISNRNGLETLVPGKKTAQERITFTQPGSNTIRVRAIDNQGVYKDQFITIYMKRNLPVIQTATANTSAWSSNKRIDVKTVMKPGTGKAPLRYVYKTYSWSRGVQNLLTSTQPIVSLTVTDADVAGIEVVAIDRVGNRDRKLIKFTLPDAWKYNNPYITASPGSNQVLLSWMTNRRPTGYAIFRDDVYVGETKTTSFSDSGFKFYTEYQYTVVPYLSTTGQSYKDTPADQLMEAYPFEKKSYSRIPYTMEELLSVPQGRERIVHIARSATNRIPYYFGNADYPGYERNGFDEYTPYADQSGRHIKGLRCSGYVEWVFWTAGYDVKGYYGWTGSIWHYTDPISRSELLPGDLALWKIGGDHDNHVGIYMGNGMWSHIWLKYGVHDPRNRVFYDDFNAWGYFRRPRVF